MTNQLQSQYNQVKQEILARFSPLLNEWEKIIREGNEIAQRYPNNKIFAQNPTNGSYMWDKFFFTNLGQVWRIHIDRRDCRISRDGKLILCWNHSIEDDSLASVELESGETLSTVQEMVTALKAEIELIKTQREKQRVEMLAEKIVIADRLLSELDNLK